MDSPANEKILHTISYDLAALIQTIPMTMMIAQGNAIIMANPD